MLVVFSLDRVQKKPWLHFAFDSYRPFPLCVFTLVGSNSHDPKFVLLNVASVAWTTLHQEKSGVQLS